ncbi:MAG: FkbM family methyltransferase [Deltaproteobacteria bacterium]|nr:FkbM family methyltransferase [Deltaproteobacteria bacterium]
MRDGLSIQLSTDHSDIVTIFLIFCRRDYGKITPGSVVVDIGANIGVFALYAAKGGAKIVHAYEPAEESFELLQRNIENNGYEDTIYPHQAAVVGKPSPPVWFPCQSSVFNAIEKENYRNKSGHQLVSTVTLAELADNVSESTMFKLDCEGGEYDIILDSEDSAFDRIEDIRLEYHRGPRQQLLARLGQLGYQCRQFMDSSEGGGYLWLTKKPP